MTSRRSRPGSPGPGPMVRGNYMRLFVAHLERLPPSVQSAIRQDVPTAIWRSATTGGVLSWLPLEVNLVFTRAVTVHVGETESQEFFRGLMLSTSQSQLLGSLVASILRVSSGDPGLAIMGISKGYDLVFRDVGHWHVLERSKGRSVLELRDLPHPCFATEGWIGSVAGALRGLGDVVRLNVSYVSAQVDEPERRVRFTGTWSP